MNEDHFQQKSRVFIQYLKHHTADFPPTLCDVMISEFGVNPFILLSACLISLRARDRVTTPLCLAFFKKIQTPEQLLAFPIQDLEKTFFSVGFYKKKAQVLREVASFLIEHHSGLVPNNLADLRAIPGVGLKTANLVLGLAFGLPAICVDVHVHKICNQLGWVATDNPDQTEHALCQILPQDLWIEWNRQLVLVGQNGCLSSKGCGKECKVLEFGILKERPV